MDRAHIFMPLLDSTGAVYPYAEVTLIDPATGQPTTTPVYTDDTTTQPVTFPLLLAPAVLDLWTPTPMRVNLQASVAQGATLTIVGVDIMPPGNAVTRSDNPLRLISPQAGMDSSSVLVAGLNNLASWQPTDLGLTHTHHGDSPGSVVLSPLNANDWAMDQTWIGSGAHGGANQGQATLALGTGATVTDADAVALGNSTMAANEGVAVGAGAGAAQGSTVLGALAQSSNPNQTVIGAQASAQAPNALVVGAKVAANASVRTAMSPAAAEDSSGNLWLGLDQASLGQDLGTMLRRLARLSACVPTYLRTHGSTRLATGGLSLGFYGTAGGTCKVIDGSTATGALLSLLQALDAMGLIYLVGGSTFVDTYADFSLTASHDPGLAIDTTNPTYFDNYAHRVKRANNDIPMSLTYSRTALQDFAVLMYTYGASDITQQLTASYTDGRGTISVPLGFSPLVPSATGGAWSSTWVFPRHKIPAKQGSSNVTLKLTLANNPNVWAPQLAKTYLR